MFGFCLRYSNNRADAQDLLQDGFIKVFDSITTLKEFSQLEGWMSRIFINLAMSKFRKSSRGPVMLDVTDVQDDQANNDFVEPEPMEIDDVLNCIMALPEKYRVVINLYAIDKFSHNEISDAIGVSVANSKSLLFRARVMLKTMVEQQRNKDAGNQ